MRDIFGGRHPPRNEMADEFGLQLALDSIFDGNRSYVLPSLGGDDQLLDSSCKNNILISYL